MFGFRVQILLVFLLSAVTPAWGALAFTDEMGRRIKFEAPPARIVIFSHYAAEVICALGEDKRIVGISNPEHAFLPELREKPSIGKSTVEPSLEKIIELRPDLVIAYQWTKKEVVARLGEWRIVFNPYQTSPAGRYAMTTPWGEFMYESPMQLQLEVAGAVNCVGKQFGNAPAMSPEWVVEHHPDVFLKIPMSGTEADRTAAAMKSLRDDILNRVELKDLAPVKKEKTFVIQPALCAGPRQVVGIYYYAKWFHPGLFSGNSPISLHQDMLQRFWGIELKDTWGYPDQ